MVARSAQPAGPGSTLTYYIYYSPASTDKTDQAVFASVDYSTTSFVARPVYISMPNITSTEITYTLRAKANNSTSVNRMIRESWTTSGSINNNVIEISTDPTSTGNPIRLIPTASFAGVDLRAIYAGVWYKAEWGDTGEVVQFKSQGLPSNTTGPFKGATANLEVAPADLEIAFVPAGGESGTNIVAVWKESSCNAISADSSLISFCYWAKGDKDSGPNNCDAIGYLGSTNLRCVFVTMEACQEHYLYQYCTAGNNCGGCLGICPVVNGTVPFCVHDWDPVLVRDNLSPLSCDPEEPVQPTVWQQYKWFFITLIFLGIFLVGLMIFFVIYLYSDPKITTDAVTTTQVRIPPSTS